MITNNKKYIMAKNFKTQNAGFIPYQIFGVVPNLIIGSPLSGYKSVPIFTPSHIYRGEHDYDINYPTGARALLRIDGEKHYVKLTIPFHKIRHFVDDFIDLAYEDKNKDKKNIIISTPIFNQKINISSNGLLNALKQIRKKHNCTCFDSKGSCSWNKALKLIEMECI